MLVLGLGGLAVATLGLMPTNADATPTRLERRVAAGALDVFNRNADSGAVTQKPRAPGCLIGTPTPGCLLGRGLRGAR